MIFTPFVAEKGRRPTKQQLQIPVFRFGIPFLLFHFLACGQWDSNPHGCPLAPKTNASANSAMTAHRSGSRLFRLPNASLSYNLGIISNFENFCQAFYGELWHQLVDSTVLVVAHGQPEVIVIIVHILADRHLLAVRTGSIGAPHARVRKAVPLFLIAVPV